MACSMSCRIGDVGGMCTLFVDYEAISERPSLCLFPGDDGSYHFAEFVRIC